MQQYRKNLGKVSLTAEGVWNIKSKYDVLSIVYDEHTQHGFISKQPVPIGVDLYNSEYWMPLNVSGYTDSNIIILNKKTSDASIETYTLEEAVKSIASVGRKPGCILGFYNSNANRLDIGGRWEIWQFNSTTISEWEDLTNWQNIYYNYNQFVGWYRNEEQLKINNPYPEVGCYAYVGNVLNEAVVYRCEIKHKWTETVQRAWDYVKVMINGTVTVGENGNWHNNGEDTGISANIKGDPGLSPYIRYNTSSNKLEYSYDKVKWIECSDYISTWFRWQATAGDTQANNVGRIQMSRDNGKTWTNMSNDFINNLHISRYVGVNESLPTSGIAEGTIYAKGPYYAEDDTLNDNPIYRLWVYSWKDNTLAWQDNGEFTSIAAGIVQETGDSETEVMSQKVVSEKLSELLKFNLYSTLGIPSKHLVLENGTIESSNVYSYTYNVHEGDKLIIDYNFNFTTDGYSVVSVWNDNTFVKSLLNSQDNDKEFMYIVPSGINKIIVSGQKDAVKIEYNHHELWQPMSMDKYENVLIQSNGTQIPSQLYTNVYKVEKGQLIKGHGGISEGFSVVSLWNDEKFVGSIVDGIGSDSDVFFHFVVPNGVNIIKALDSVKLFSSFNGLCPIEAFPQNQEKHLILENGNIENSLMFTTSYYDVDDGDVCDITILNQDYTSIGYSIISLWNNKFFVKNVLSSPAIAGENIKVKIPVGVNKIAISNSHTIKKQTNIGDWINYVNSTNNKKKIKCLFIGNSVNQDHIAYLPWLLKNTYPELDFEIYIVYIGSWTVKGYVEEVITGNKNIGIFSYAKNTENWSNIEDVPMRDIWKNGPFDIISFEGYFNPNPSYLPSEDSGYFRQFYDYLKANNTSPFKLGYLLHQTYDFYGEVPHTKEQVMKDIIQGAKDAIINTPTSILFPVGIASSLALNNFEVSFLTNDNIHNQQGLPCIMGAYVVMGEISRYLGFKDMIINNKLRITQDKETHLNIPGVNGTLQIGTEEQYSAAQMYAVQSISFGDWLISDASKSILYEL